MFKKKPIKIYGDNIYSFEFVDNIAIESHKNVKGSKIHKLESIYNSLPYWESKFYKEKIRSFYNNLDRNSVILDAGCGDGRFTLMLLEMGFTNIVSLDSNLDSLLQLESDVKKNGMGKKISIVHCNIIDLPFKEKYFDSILCIGVLYYLNDDYEKALLRIINCLKSNGTFVETEPDQEGNAIKALFFDGLERFLKVVSESRFIEIFNGEEVELRCFSDNEIDKIRKKINLRVLKTESISLFPSILTIGTKKKLIESDNLEKLTNDIHNAFKYLNSLNGIAKHKFWILEKNEYSKK